MEEKQVKINGISGHWSPYCSVCGVVKKRRVCYRKDYDKILCDKHNLQLKSRGKIVEQTKFATNTIRIDGDVVYIALNNRGGEIIDWAIIDLEDIEKIKGYKWYKRKDGRVVTNTAKLNIGVSHLRIHNIVMDFDESLKYKEEVDHINNNVLDNRKENLRIVSKSKNVMNKGLQSNNSTGVCGVVSRDHDGTSPWIPQIKINGKMIRLGSENSFDKAVKKRLVKESDLFNVNSNNFNPTTQTLQLTYLSHDDNKQTYLEITLDGTILQFNKL